ncbi:MAG TPA: dienelactone hydrolase family protein [Gemmataceae bacterium]|jgi:carboxymethylenebutenolidase|nr:dienelactone hydrolase family protein [Gemmataceae bacterium]
MKRILVSVTVVLLSCSGAFAQDFAKKRLEKSTRHQEWVEVKHDGRSVHSFIVYPEVKDKAAAVLVIHEIFGMTDWVRSLADQLAEAGYIAIAPDLLSGMGPNGGKTDAFSGQNEVMQAIRRLPAEQITSDLNAVSDYVTKLPAANGKLSVCGFCWGGGQSFRYATNNKNLRGAYVFYGPPPAKEDMARINCPVYGFYGENDARINATIDKTKELMKEASKTYEPVIYDGAGHGFMRQGEDPRGRDPDKKARDEAWKRWKELLKNS